MKSFALRGSIFALTAMIAVVGLGTAAQLHAQQAIASPRLATQGEWDAGTTYAKDDIVSARGSAWISLRNNNVNKVPGQTQPSTAAYWRLFARGFNPAGAWSNATKYQPDDLVTFSGQTWRARITNANRQPTANQFWELLVTKGAVGAQGPQGPQGPAGDTTGISAGNQVHPAIAFSGDSDTGIYSPGAGKIAMVENGEMFMHNVGAFNTALGNAALRVLGPGVDNTAVGASALSINDNGSYNTAVGAGALASSTSGTNNIAMGMSSLAGLFSGINNIAIGNNALSSTNGDANIAIGNQSLLGNVAGDNVAIGHGAVGGFGNGAANVAVGNGALLSNTDGGGNTAIGNSALNTNTTGINNIAIGLQAGTFPTAPANSIFIGNQGLSGDTTTIRIGTQGTQNTAFMAGIAGVTVANGAAVLIDTTTGQLGTVASSRRYKEDIAAMDDMTGMLAKLRPVTFHYKAERDDGLHELQFGLIAEEVAEVQPYLTVFNKEGTPETVKYHLLPTFLLAGWQAQQHTIAAQADEIGELKRRLAAIEAMLPRPKAASLQ